jgi:hypothetical protein
MSSEINSNGGFELEKSWIALVDRGCSASRLDEVLQQVTGCPFIDGERWFITGEKGISSGREATARRALHARDVRPRCNGASLSE